MRQVRIATMAARAGAPPRAAALVAVVAAITAVLWAPPSEAAARSSPSIAIASVRPLVVTGRGFRAHERVRVTVSDGTATWTRRVRVTARRRFRVGFGDLPVVRCSLIARAFGSRGSRATSKPAEPGCPEPEPVPPSTAVPAAG